MTALLISILLFIIFFMLYRHEKRRFINALVLFGACILLFYGIGDFAYVYGLSNVHQIFLAILYILVP